MRSAWGLEVERDVDWRQRAACGPDTAELFFVPERAKTGRGGLTKGNLKALEICAGCPVRRQCYRDAEASPSPAARIAGGVAWMANGNVRDTGRARLVAHG